MAWAACGLAAVPIIVHLLTRRRYDREPWAAMRFLRRAHRRTRHRTRLEQWLLLSLRTLAMALVALAIARPMTDRFRSLTSGRNARAQRIIILDNSGSMQAHGEGGTPIFGGA